MAKAKAEINKSEEIRKIYAQNPEATAKDIISQLKTQVIEASEGLVYSCKPGQKKKKKVQKEKVAPSSTGALSVGESIAVAAQRVGGWAALKELVDALQ